MLGLSPLRYSFGWYLYFGSGRRLLIILNMWRLNSRISSFSLTLGSPDSSPFFPPLAAFLVAVHLLNFVNDTLFNLLGSPLNLNIWNESNSSEILCAIRCIKINYRHQVATQRSFNNFKEAVLSTEVTLLLKCFSPQRDPLSRNSLPFPRIHYEQSVAATQSSISGQLIIFFNMRSVSHVSVSNRRFRLHTVMQWSVPKSYIHHSFLLTVWALTLMLKLRFFKLFVSASRQWLSTK